MPLAAPRCCATCSRSLDNQALYCGTCGHRSGRRRESHAGTILGERYRIEAKIADGGFGVVYRATHLSSGIEVALKLLHADLAGDSRIAERFRRESRGLARLRDPHTVVTYERGEFRDGAPYIAMELLHGQTLLERFRTRGPLLWNDVLALLRGACWSLDEAHAHGIVHRDLKPANLFLADHDQLKVLDFGVARFVVERSRADRSEITAVGQVIGTLDYMAPEQLDGVPCTPRSDIYALGVIAYEMICGRRPFPDADRAESLMSALVMQTPPLPSQLALVPGAIDRVLLRCLAFDPDRRFQTIAELAKAIDDILGAATPTPSPRHAQSHRVTRPPVRTLDRVAIYSLGAAITTIGATIGWMAMTR